MAGNWFPLAELTGSGRPVLHSGEFESSLLSGVDLSCDDNPSFSLLKSGLLVLTAHRLIWIDQSSPASSAVAASVPLAAVIRIFSPHKSIKSMFSSPRIRVQVTATPEGMVEEGGPRSVVITFTVRGKSDLDSFLTKLWEAWRGRAWESARVSGSGSGDGRGSTADETCGPSFEIKIPIVGVSGILRKEQEMWESTDKNLQDAFKDLNALMSKAKEMVMLAEKMRLKLLSSSNNQASATNDEEMGSKQEMQDWLLSIGVASPVTKETAGALYHQQLARQLADFVKIPLERAGGVINLIDVYCLFNRARGTELISPEDLLQACSIWEKFDIPVMLRRFDSGVLVIQNKSHSDEEVFSRLKSLVLNPVVLQMGISASDAARALGITPAMAKEHLLSAESKGLLCRDVSPDGFRFYINLFNEIDTDDPHMVRDHGVYAAWVNAAIVSR